MDLSITAIDWLKLSELSKRDQSRFTAKSDAENNLLKLGPATALYFSPVPSLFLSELNPMGINSTCAYGEGHEVIARDGLAPLIHFFESHRKPTSAMLKIYVHEKIGHVVPDKWRNQSGLYRVVSSRDDRSSECLGLTLIGAVTPEYCSISGLEKLFADLKDSMGTDFRNIPISLALHGGRVDKNRRRLQRFQWDFVARLSELAGGRLSLISESGPDWSTQRIFDLNERHNIADSAFVHQCLASGAKLLGSKRKRSARYVAVSQHHGFELRDFSV